MSSKIALAVALALAIGYAIPASAGPRTCGHSTMSTTALAPGLAPTATDHALRSGMQHSASAE
jgi:hypothetical protein